MLQNKLRLQNNKRMLSKLQALLLKYLKKELLLVKKLQNLSRLLELPLQLWNLSSVLHGKCTKMKPFKLELMLSIWLLKKKLTLKMKFQPLWVKWQSMLHMLENKRYKTLNSKEKEESRDALTILWTKSTL